MRARDCRDGSVRGGLTRVGAGASGARPKMLRLMPSTYAESTRFGERPLARLARVAPEVKGRTLERFVPV